MDSGWVTDGVGDSSSEGEEELERALKLHAGQIFLGMVAMQYKAKQEVVKLVEKLTKSCIRFVHFSFDNEQISRVRTSLFPYSFL